ncbi:MAG: alpha/beta fold hydrolase [Phycisphaerales bacterium]|nr:alpha/beta fold hydrolase [Phycisphaerales bacterium]
MARYEELSIPLPDGYRAYARYFHAPRPIGSILYHHGIQSHCGWYEASAAALADAGYDVLQGDRRGSGRNEIDRGHAESAEQLIVDSHIARDELLRRSDRSDYHLVGISWGGKLVVAACVNDPAGVKSLTLVTPGLFPKIGVSRGEMARIGFSMLYEPRRHFDIPLNDPDLFTTNPRWAEFFRTDPFTLRQCTAAFYLASRRMDRIVARLKESPPVPIHLFLAGDERIVDNDRTADFFDDLDWSGTQTTMHETARHSLEFEGDATIYFQQLVSFIAAVR